MSSVLVNSVISCDFLHKFKGPVVSMVISWCIVEHSNTSVNHLVISHHLKRWGVDGLLGVNSSLINAFLKRSKLLFNLFNYGFVINISCCNNNDVVSNKVISSPFVNVMSVEKRNVVKVSFLWLSQVMVSEGVEMSIF